MTWEQTLLRIGSHDVTALEAALASASFAILLLVLIAILAWRAQHVRRDEA
jgi:hypothetical protein